ncbi:phage baseplate assembly protein [Novacetimonas hansenii]|uniref:Uncharacterized protein n=1 Tax=Novacetimonas hansenii TaxID=436 RepID=A0ABQ0SHB1_NOVHA|nr:hypothetical protein [Novacetimonas hansenii]GAN84021.1 Mu P family protein [Novacetimonas hansenii JCM 7643]GBQ55784.1 hypothetical protein AA0243_1009 [Novacetimonas hansenii NRIC 0243]GEC64601.1 hypothetical protein GHA01_24500 [Novacetimonas hansenii]
MSDITVTAKAPYRPPTNDLYVRINSILYSNFISFRFTRSMENVPSTFTMELLCYGDTLPVVTMNEPVEIYLQKKQIFSGMIEMRSIIVNGNNTHSLSISGRSKLKKLVDDMPEYAGTSINNIQTLEDLCLQVCKTCGNVGVYNLSTTNDKMAWNSVPYNIGDTGWSILDRYARYQGKLLYDNGYGALVINDVAKTATTTINETSPLRSYGFSEDITQRYAQYKVLWQPYTTLSQTGLPPAATSSDPQATIFNGEGRTKITINSTSDEDGSLAQRYAQWQANRAYGRSRSVTVELVGFTDASNTLWDVNQMVNINLPMIGVNEAMVTCDVTYSYSNGGGSTTEITFYPALAFTFEPATLYQSDPSLQNLPSA